MYRIGFIIEQALGHITHGRNLERNVSRDDSIEAYWGFPGQATTGLAARVSNWTLQAGMQSRRQIAAMQHQAKQDALFFHTQVTAVLAQRWLQRIPSIVSLDATPLQYDSLGEFYSHETGPNWVERGKWRLNRRCFQEARWLVTWSDWAKQGLVEGYGISAEKIIAIPPGVNIAEWQRPAPRPRHNQPIKILFVGGNLRRKGGELLLAAHRALRQEGHITELHLVTHDTVSAESGVFVHNQMQPNSKPLIRLFHQCDIFCLPTYGDCLPMALSEAGAAGLPTVTTRVAAIPELVQDGQTGFLVKPGDAQSLTTALRRLIADPALRLRQGAAAIEYVGDKFDAQRNTTRLLDLLKQMIDEDRHVHRRSVS